MGSSPLTLWSKVSHEELDLRNEFVNIQLAAKAKCSTNAIRQFTTQIPEVMAHRQSYLDIQVFFKANRCLMFNPMSEHEVKQEIAASSN